MRSLTQTFHSFRQGRLIFATRRRIRQDGSSLLITLAIVVLALILVLGVLSVARLERQSAQDSFNSLQAKTFAEMGADEAVSLIRDGITAAEQTTTNTTAAERRFWASQPGRITVFKNDGTVDTNLSRNLYSASSTNLVDLNRACFDGSRPIISAMTNHPAPEMKVGWVNVLSNPTKPASATNALIGRYAFWVDDETTKLNLNTSDGTAKGTPNSFGPGVPPEVSLQGLKNGGANFPASDALALAQRTGLRPTNSAKTRLFNTPREALAVPGIATNTLTKNLSDLTSYSRTPELNVFGEPKIYLATTATETKSVISGPYPGPGISDASAPLTYLYPQGGIVGPTRTNTWQLPPFKYTAPGDSTTTITRLPQTFQADAWTYSWFSPGHPDYDIGMRIAQYLKGNNSQANPIPWPQFLGADLSGFAGKYTDRQIDSIALQIVSLLSGAYADHGRGYTVPAVMTKGFLSGQLVKGLNRGPRVNEILIRVATLAGAPSRVKVGIWIEWVFPKEFRTEISSDQKMYLTDQQTGTDMWQWNYGEGNTANFLNFQDACRNPNGSSPLGGFWMDNLLVIKDAATQESAGLDLWGNDPDKADPDQINAAKTHHPWAMGGPMLPGPDRVLGTSDDVPNPYVGQYMGSGPYPGGPTPVLSMYNPTVAPGGAWEIGGYRCSGNAFTMDNVYPLKTGVQKIVIGGGLAVGLHTASGSAYYGASVDPVPLESLRGVYTGEYQYDANGNWSINPSARDAVIAAVIPIPDVEVEIGEDPVYIHLQVADPLVNGFPGDWVATFGSEAKIRPEVTMGSWLPASAGTDAAGHYTNGLNTIAKASEGADPKSTWWPEQNLKIPKSQRFPSAGYLQYVRTGLIPDKDNDLNYTTNSSLKPSQQKGTPYRTLNLGPSTSSSQGTLGGTSYPDWAMLDLFTVPAIFQPLGTPLPAAISLTWGGATSGRINPNAVLVPFQNADGTPLVRTTPLESLFKGTEISTAYDSAENAATKTVDEVAVANAVTAYIANLKDSAGNSRPLLLPGEISNVPEVAANIYQGVPAPSRSRNDLVRQVIGNLTTRSSTFVVWSIGQVIKKKPGNLSPGEFESGDHVLGEKRIKFLVERYLDPGADGVYGSARRPGVDLIVGTPDDIINDASGNHPALTYPLAYKYRVTAFSILNE